MRFEPILWAVCNGIIWSGIMDKVFPRFFDQLPKPFGCSPCMAFWAAVAYSVTTSILPVAMFTPEAIAIPFVSLWSAAMAYRTFRLL